MVNTAMRSSKPSATPTRRLRLARRRRVPPGTPTAEATAPTAARAWASPRLPARIRRRPRAIRPTGPLRRAPRPSCPTSRQALRWRPRRRRARGRYRWQPVRLPQAGRPTGPARYSIERSRSRSAREMDGSDLQPRSSRWSLATAVRSGIGTSRQDFSVVSAGDISARMATCPVSLRSPRRLSRLT